MAVDNSQNLKNSKEKIRLKLWKELITAKCREKSQKIKPRLLKISGYWKSLAAILVAYLIYSALNDCSTPYEDEEDNEYRDVSSSLVSMEPLLEIEQKLVQALDSYANELQQKLNTIRNGIAQMRQTNEIYNIDAEKFLGNPLNSFKMLRRLKTEWKAWEMYLRKSIGKVQITSIHQTIETITDYDIFESVHCIETLRDIYDIQPSDWIEGVLHHKKYDEKFGVVDAYSMGILLFLQKNYIAANEWFMIALERYEHSDMYPFLDFDRSHIVDSFADNYLMQNQTDLSQMLLNSALMNDSYNSKFLKKKSEIDKLNLKVLKSPNVKKNAKELKMQDSIRRGCQGEYIANASIQVFCYYNTSANDFVRLAPFKVEEISLDPIILLYHDIINDDEIMELKSIARKDLTRSGTVGILSAPYRISKNAWLHASQYEVVFDIDQRIEDMLGLQLKDEELLVGNYGLGGFYKQHEDCLDVCDDDDDSLDCDYRMISVLFYMTDVESGGGTIFPHLEVGAVPQKGTALIWYNLKSDLWSCDLRTTHMACPVVVGSKWFAIKWVRANKQTFRKPCYRNITNDYGLDEQSN